MKIHCSCRLNNSTKCVSKCNDKTNGKNKHLLDDEIWHFFLCRLFATHISFFLLFYQRVSVYYLEMKTQPRNMRSGLLNIYIYSWRETKFYLWWINRWNCTIINMRHINTFLSFSDDFSAFSAACYLICCIILFVFSNGIL